MGKRDTHVDAITAQIPQQIITSAKLREICGEEWKRFILCLHLRILKPPVLLPSSAALLLLLCWCFKLSELTLSAGAPFLSAVSLFTKNTHTHTHTVEVEDNKMAFSSTKEKKQSTLPSLPPSPSLTIQRSQLWWRMLARAPLVFLTAASRTRQGNTPRSGLWLEHTPLYVLSQRESVFCSI